MVHLRPFTVKGTPNKVHGRKVWRFKTLPESINNNHSIHNMQNKMGRYRTWISCYTRGCFFEFEKFVNEFALKRPFHPSLSPAG